MDFASSYKAATAICDFVTKQFYQKPYADIN